MKPTSKLMIKKDNLIFFGPGVEILLNGIRSQGSVKEAAENIGLSYSKAWTIIRNAEKGSGVKLVNRNHGGCGGGSSSLTAEGIILLEKYISFKEEAESLIKDAFRRHFND